MARQSELAGLDSLVLAAIPHSPMQTLMIDWVGSEGGRIFYHLADYPDVVESLYHALCKSRAAVTASTENLVSNEHLIALTQVLGSARLPLR